MENINFGEKKNGLLKDNEIEELKSEVHAIKRSIEELKCDILEIKRMIMNVHNI